MTFIFIYDAKFIQGNLFHFFEKKYVVSFGKSYPQLCAGMHLLAHFFVSY